MPLDSKDSNARGLHTKCDVQGRTFLIDMLLMTNGCFASISEDSSSKMGAITVSIRSDRGTNSSTLIPDRRGGIFASTLGEFLAEKTRGIAVVSLFLRQELDSDSMRALMEAVRKQLPSNA